MSLSIFIITKDLRKLEYSNFCSFAKFKTHSIPYSVFLYCLKYELMQNTKQMTKLTKNPYLTQKQGFITQKHGIPNILYCIEYLECVLFHIPYKIITLNLYFYFCKNFVLTWIPTQSLIHEFGMQGLNHYISKLDCSSMFYLFIVCNCPCNRGWFWIE